MTAVDGPWADYDMRAGWNGLAEDLRVTDSYSRCIGHGWHEAELFVRYCSQVGQFVQRSCGDVFGFSKVIAKFSSKFILHGWVDAEKPSSPAQSTGCCFVAFDELAKFREEEE